MQGNERKPIAEVFEPLIDSIEAAELLGVHPESVRRRARDGEIPGLKFGKLWRFRLSVLEAHVQKMMLKNRDIPIDNMAPSDTAVCAVRNRRR